MAQPSSVETRASGTAAATAFLRALAACDPDEALRGSDYLAGIFLEAEQQALLRDPAQRAWVLKNQLAPGAYELILARTAFFDQIVAQALKDNLEQIVLLGAGYDSRPYRFKELIRDTRIFEVDAPPTQQRKQECLRQAGLSISPQISFAPIDFETGSLREVLQAAGYQPTSQTLFVWEGVSYYLSREAVDQTLAAVRAISPVGSRLSFDYAALSAKVLNDEGVQEFRQLMRSRYANEPTRFGVPVGQIELFLNERGFQTVEHLTAAEMDEKYLPRKSGLETGKVSPLFCLVLARVM